MNSEELKDNLNAVELYFLELRNWKEDYEQECGIKPSDEEIRQWGLAFWKQFK